MKSYTLKPYTFTLNFNLLFEVPSKECFKSLPTISVGRNNTRYASLRLDLRPYSVVLRTHSLHSNLSLFSTCAV